MLYPQCNASRSVIDLSGIWDFRLTEEEPWQNIAVPASYNDQKPDPRFRTHCGPVWYRTKFTIPKFWENQRRVLRFDAVTHDAVVYVNSCEIARHKGGFLPFEIDITDLVQPGELALLEVQTDNRIHHGTLPVGNETGVSFFGSDNAGIPSVEAGKRKQVEEGINLPNFDFFNYAGINRPVRIYSTPCRYIEDITLVTFLDGTVHYTVKTAKAEAASLNNVLPVLSILDSEGVLVTDTTRVTDTNETTETTKVSDTARATDTTETTEVTDATKSTDTTKVTETKSATEANMEEYAGELHVANPHLWEPVPGTPYLYTFRVQYGDDCYELPFGIRTVRVENNRFLINEKPFYFKGPCKHEDSAFHGRGLDTCLNVTDIGLYHWLNANAFRTSHYPYAEEMYQLCDREGIVIIDETPAVGIGAGPDCDPYTTFPLKEYHAQVLHDMIERDKNHPCVVMWSLGNEPDTWHFPESAYTYWNCLYKQAHRQDPQNRPVTMVGCQNDYTKDITTPSMDVVCINRYYGWYNLSGDLEAAKYAFNLELEFWKKLNKPLILSEYGADTINGLHGAVAEMFTEEFQIAFYEAINSCLDACDFVTGELPWNFADFNTIQGPMRAGGNRKGLFTRDRKPKMAAHYLRNRWKNLRV